MKKPCESCKRKDEELARLRESQASQIKAQILDTERKHEYELTRLEERVDWLLRILAKISGATL